MAAARRMFGGRNCRGPQPMRRPVIPIACRRKLFRPVCRASVQPHQIPPVVSFNCSLPPSTLLPSTHLPAIIAIDSLIMSLSSASSTLLRACARQQLPTTRAAVASCQQRRGLSEASKSSSFDSPFGNSHEYQSTLKIPSFSKYASNKPPRSNQVFSYFMAGALGLGSAVGAKATVQGR